MMWIENSCFLSLYADGMSAQCLHIVVHCWDIESRVHWLVNRSWFGSVPPCHIAHRQAGVSHTTNKKHGILGGPPRLALGLANRATFEKLLWMFYLRVTGQSRIIDDIPFVNDCLTKH